MDEIDFLLLHKIVVHQLKAKGDMKVAMRLMKFNRIVSKRVLDVHKEDQEEREGNEALTTDMQPSTSKVKKRQQKKQTRRKKKDASQNEENRDGNQQIISKGFVESNTNKKREVGPSDELLADVIYKRLDWQKGTQRGEGDEVFQSNIDQLRNSFLVDEIKAEDFDSEYEKDSENTAIMAKRKSDNIENEPSTSGQPVSYSKRLKTSIGNEGKVQRNMSEEDDTEKKKESKKTSKDKQSKDEEKKLKEENKISKQEKQKSKKEEQSSAITRMIHEIERELMEEGKEPFEVSNEVVDSHLKVKINE